MTFNLPGGLCLALYLALSVWDCVLQETNRRDFFVKPLLMPLLIDVRLSDAENAEFLPFLREMGYAIDPIGPNSFAIKEIPTYMGNGFMTEAPRTLILLAAALCFALALAATARRLVPHFPEKLRAGFFVYSGTIIAMSLSALFRFLSIGNAGAGISFAGSLLFILSDTLIACRVAFHRKMKGVMETYLPAQLLIVLGFLI